MKLSRCIIVALGTKTKIADITHADVLTHGITPASMGLEADTKAVYIYALRIAGTGTFVLKDSAGGTLEQISTGSCGLWTVDEDDDTFYYALSVANDDWDIFESMCHFRQGSA